MNTAVGHARLSGPGIPIPVPIKEHQDGVQCGKDTIQCLLLVKADIFPLEIGLDQVAGIFFVQKKTDEFVAGGLYVFILVAVLDIAVCLVNKGTAPLVGLNGIRLSSHQKHNVFCTAVQEFLLYLR